MIRINLVGGLGNQFFQYYAGLATANGDYKQLQIWTAFSQFGITGHEGLISGMGLPGKFLNPKSSSRVSHAVNIVLRSFEEGLGEIGHGRRGVPKISGCFKSNQLGFDPALSGLRASGRLSLWGYFQTWRYADWLVSRNLFPYPRLESPSSWFLKQTSMQRMARTLVIHVRRGDYVGSAIFGTLPKEYYLSAIRELRQRGAQWDQIVLYSDEIGLAYSELSDALKSETVIVATPPKNCHPGESLLAMAESDYIVIANSTFSWWSGFLSQRARIVVRPEKWFLGMDDPVDLFPHDWASVPNYWD